MSVTRMHSNPLPGEQRDCPRSPAEFWVFPEWAAGADLMFADAAGWNRPIRFAHGVGGHACVREVATAARRAGVRRLVFAHIGRPSIRAIDRGERPPFGQWGREGAEFRLMP